MTTQSRPESVGPEPAAVFVGNTRQAAYDSMRSVKEAKFLDDDDYAMADAIHDAVLRATNHQPVALDVAEVARLLAALERFIDFSGGRPQYVTANGIRQDVPHSLISSAASVRNTLRAALAKENE